MTDQKFEYGVFLSYTSKDKQIVQALSKRLKKEGLRVWLDTWVIKPGDPNGLKIQQRVEKSQTLIMCMFPDYFESEREKLEHHSMLFRYPSNTQRRFLPILIKDCQKPDIIEQFAHIDWRTSSGATYQSLLDTCRLDGPKNDESPAKQQTLSDGLNEVPISLESEIRRPVHFAMRQV
jgi:hypothetical protein